jgi:YidC/Oxa1 family membrane protein insertase
MFDFLFDGIASALAFLYDATGSYAASIMLLTLGVMFIVTPLTLKSTRSMIAMQQLQPELRKLQAKYKDDRQKLNEEMMAFYKEHNISPLGGCLPLIVQTPVFIVLYQVLIGLTRAHPYGEDMGRAAGLLIRNPDGGGFYENFGTFDPKYLEHTTNLYQDLSRAREMLDFGGGLDLADTLTQRLSDGGFVHALPYIVLVAIVAVSAWFQQRQIMARNAGNQTQINPQQQALMKIMPFFLPIFSFTVPAALVVYFLVSNLWRIGQQAVITRTLYAGAPAPALPIEVDEVPPKAAAKADRPAKTTSKSGDAGTPTRSPMGRNRRAAEGDNGASPPRSRTRAPKPKPKPDRAPTASGRVTPPGTSARKKKRT